MSTWLAVVAGGAVGAPLRYLLDRAVTTRTAGTQPPREFPYGLLVVNVLGSAIAGLVLATTTGDLRVLLLAGFCGAFTTFSGFGWEVTRLWDTSRGTFWAAVLVMPAACLAAFLGFWRLGALLAG